MEIQHLKNQLVHPKENIYFALTALFSIICYLYLLITIIGIVIIAFIILIPLFFHGLSMASIRRNGVRISERQFPDIYGKSAALAREMGLEKMPSIYVMESSGFLNAFATRFFGKNMVVVYSEIFDLSEEGKEDQLLFVLAHEFAHLKRRHVLVNMLLMPAMYMPFLGEAYLRGCEFTCDRYAAYYTGNLESSKEALTMLAIGKKLAPKVNQAAFIEQIREESGFFSWLSERLSSHPDLPKRLNALDHWTDPGTFPLYKEKTGRVAAGVAVLVFVCVAVPAAVITGIYQSGILDELDSLGTETAGAEEYSYEDEEVPLMLSHAGEGNVEEFKTLMAGGEDVRVKDSDGATAIHYAAQSGNPEMVQMLLAIGFNVNAKDDFGSTPLMWAVYYGDADMTELLLQKGADPNMKDNEGQSASGYAQSEDNQEMLNLLGE